MARPAEGRRPIRVLLVEADLPESRRLHKLLRGLPHARFAIDRARDLRTGLARLGEAGHDVCLVAQELADGRGLELLQAAERHQWRTPIIMLAERVTFELDLEAMALGVADVLDRRGLDATLLERSIRYALARQRRAERLGQHDQLTGLASRSLFHDRLERALAWARRHERLVAVMILDLNGFKTVNDQLGHAAGDRLLSLMAKRLSERLRETDTVARLGGDEFALVIENLAKPEYAALVARKLLDRVVAPAPIDGREVRVTASLGVALYPRDGQDGASLVHAADRAMYRAKAEGGNLCRFSSAQLERRVQRGALLETDLRRALDEGQLVLHFQPQVRLAAGRLGISGLLRWQHPELGLLDAERFLPLAADAGLLEPLTDRLFEAACAQGRQWHDLTSTELHLAIPLPSRRQLAWSGLAQRLADCLARAGLPPRCLEIELDEELLLAEVAACGSGLAALKEIGVRVALDRFGEGLTSLRGLRLGMLDTLKLARELHGGLVGHREAALVGAIIALARELGLRVVAEGVDRQDQLAFLRQRGCHAIQAFMSCPPLPPDACTSWLRQAGGRRGERASSQTASTPGLPALVGSTPALPPWIALTPG